MNQLKLLHISDVHLEAKFSFLGEKAQEYRKQIVRTLESVFEIAKDKQVNLVLITGDLFDTPYPSKITLDIVRNLFQKMAKEGMFVVVIPGNHDFLKEGSVYMNENLSQNNPRIIIFNNPLKTRTEIDELGIVLYAGINSLQKSAASPIPKRIDDDGPLPSLDKQLTKEYKSIALAHGSLVTTNTGTNYPITPEDIRNSHFDYLALGDWHGLLDVSQGKVKAWYPGSLEPLAIDQKNAGYALIVDIAEQVKVTPVKIGRFEVAKLDINIKNLGSKSLLEFVDFEIESLAKKGVELKNLLLEVDLSGDLALDQTIDLEALSEYFKDKVFYIKFNNKLSISIKEEEKRKYPEYTLIGKFIEYMEAKRKTIKDPTLIDEVIKKGIGYVD